MSDGGLNRQDAKDAKKRTKVEKNFHFLVSLYFLALSLCISWRSWRLGGSD
jgi:hypothetical protein